MDAVEATMRYETWLGSQTPLVAEDLATKHQAMTASAFPFLRGTFYLWSLRWPEVCPDLASAGRVLGIGDLHVENYGTWRDEEGRLAWGVNDFDEATELPYTNDLVRLATSVLVAAREDRVTLDPRTACEAILHGYHTRLASGGVPYVLAENHPKLRRMATGALRDPARFWRRMAAVPPASGVTPDLRRRLVSTLPARGLDYRLLSRVAGVGSLGRTRVMALATFEGGLVAREAKAMVPSAWDWARSLDEHGEPPPAPRFAVLMNGPYRSADPCLWAKNTWQIRRLAPDCTRIELASLPRKRDERLLVESMGGELANVHLGTEGAGTRIMDDLARRPDGWLLDSARRMAASVVADWKDWQRSAPAKRAHDVAPEVQG